MVSFGTRSSLSSWTVFLLIITYSYSACTRLIICYLFSVLVRNSRLAGNYIVCMSVKPVMVRILFLTRPERKMYLDNKFELYHDLFNTSKRLSRRTNSIFFSFLRILMLLPCRLSVQLAASSVVSMISTFLTFTTFTIESGCYPSEDWEKPSPRIIV